uniref:Methionine synthase reductase n=1 Tax=Panagrellus redivivus TaxID=6233 RepID=A0A7E4W6X1_PANRE
MTLSKDFLILFGSQTGQAESIADQIYAKCIDMKLDPRLCRMDEVDKEFFIEKETFAVIVVSSTGDGDPPENAHRFFRKICRKTLASDFLSGLEYALLGLGDSNYSTYQGVPKKLDKTLAGLGGVRVLPRGEADDQVGLELVVEPWCDQLYEYLAKRFECSKDEKQIATATLADSADLEIVKDVLPGLESQLSSITMSNQDESGDGEAPSNVIPHLGIEPIPFPEEGVSLIRGSPTITADHNLRIPVAPQSFIASAVSHEKFDSTSTPWQNSDHFPGQHTPPVEARVVTVSEISADISPEEGKGKRLIEIAIQGDSPDVDSFLKDCDAGDSVYFVFPNPTKEVDFILDRLGLLALADNTLKLGVDPKSEKRDPKLPAYFPNPASLRYVLTHCVDIRRSPSRPLLRVFAEHANDAEKRRLLELCSAQGVAEFTAHVRQAGLSLVDFLIAFPSVKPPVDRLLELLPRLIPRPYSVSNHQSRHGRRIRFVYSCLKFPATTGKQYEHFGVCTEYLKSLQVGDTVQVILKEPSKFRLPPLARAGQPIWDIPLLLIGPGTGVAPFASFFQKLLAHKIQHETSGEGPLPQVKRYLFYGSRNLSEEFILKDELESLSREGVISDLVLCESRVPDSPHQKYVQDALRLRGKEIVDFITADVTPAPLIFACGDGKGLSKDLFACFSELLQTHLGKTAPEAMALLKQLKDSERYIEDVWSSGMSTPIARAAKTAIKSVTVDATVAKRPKKVWPNFFLTFRVRNQDIVTAVDSLYAALLETNVEFESKLVPSRALHVTLGVGRFENDDELKTARQALTDAITAFTATHTKPLEATFHGISNFQKRVLFGSVHPDSDPGLQLLYQCISKSFSDNSLALLDGNRAFHPHLTLAKLQIPRDMKMAKDLFQHRNADHIFGTEIIDEIMLCKMHMDKNKDEFYQVLHTITLPKL